MKLVSDSYYEFYDGPATKGKSRREHLEQVDAVSFTRYNYPHILFFHPVNEGAIPVQYRSKLLESGMLSGVSDFVILHPSGEYHGALIEMKRANKADSRVSEDQVSVMKMARAAGYFTAVAFGAEQYQKALLYYLSL